MTKEERIKAIAEWRKENPPSRYSKYNAGIYKWMNKKGEIVYIGESTRPQKRKEKHIWDCDNNIPKEILKDCEWDMMEYIDDKRERRIRELELIVEHKPIYNKPYRID